MSRQDPRTPEIARLATAAQRGDVAALGNLFDLVQKDVFRFCVYLSGAPHLGEELSQEVFLRVLNSIGSLKKPGQFLAWAFVIARNLFVDRMRDKRETCELTESDLETCVSEDLAEDRKLTVLEVQKVLSTLDVDTRTLIILAYIEEMSHNEVAEALNISTDLVKSRLFWARKRFKSRYQKVSTSRSPIPSTS